MYSEIRWRLISAIAASLLLIFFYAFEIFILGLLTPFLLLPLLAGTWLVVILAGAVSFTCLLKFKTMGYRALVPTGVIAASVLIVLTVPLARFWTDAFFYLYKEDRAEIIEKIYLNELMPNVAQNPDLITLGDDYPLVSMGGNDVVYEVHDGKHYVLFFVVRGVLDNYSGFLHVSDGGAPSEFRDLDEAERTTIIPLEQDWYLVAHQ